MKTRAGAIVEHFRVNEGAPKEAKWKVSVPYLGKSKTVKVTAKDEFDALQKAWDKVGVNGENSLVVRQSKAVKVSESTVESDDLDENMALRNATKKTTDKMVKDGARREKWKRVAKKMKEAGIEESEISEMETELFEDIESTDGK